MTKRDEHHNRTPRIVANNGKGVKNDKHPDFDRDAKDAGHKTPEVNVPT
jgi:hypothetical protein